MSNSLNDGRIHPSQIKILLLLRCIEPVYAEKMIKQGSLYFNYPINWIKKAEKEGKMGQGVPLEGVYAEEEYDAFV